MSKLLDKLEQVSEGRGQPLGFGAAVNRAKMLPMLIIGGISEGNAKLAVNAEKANVDAILVTIEHPKKKDDAVSQLKSADIKIPWGLALDTVTRGDIDQLIEAGCDFVAFSPAKTPAAILSEEKIGKVLQIDPSLEDNLARAINRLSVDAVLLDPASEDESLLTVNQLMAYERLAAVAGKQILAMIPADFPVEDIESLWGIGARGVVVDLAVKDPDERLIQVKEAIGKLPTGKKKPGGKISASIPFMRESAAAEPPEEDDDDI